MLFQQDNAADPLKNNFFLNISRKAMSAANENHNYFHL